ncbi:ankyrin repeat domain-containing protein 39 homolog [Impatiens glandulifera]|uniref:ankyrin repeat domain-containing protein 39 homolog n=1 Tax=Impatiens glandulifera TaxID=253017 RepID=UPI001FB12597|nr:ankyrin repeat domain-containing protein 39 homolog [Impatiens glandulifera]
MVLTPNNKELVIQFLDNTIYDVFYSDSDSDDFISEDDVNSSYDENRDENWDEHIRIMLSTIDENNIAPHFKDMALAMKERDVNGLQIAIDNFTGDIDEYSIDGETALHYILVGRGANMEAKNKKGAIPLHYACDNSLFNIVEFIFNNISDKDIRKRMLNSVDSDDSTPMHKAAGCEDINIVKLLLDIAKEIDNSACIRNMIEAVDEDGQTPLHEAAYFGKLKIVILLLEFGASPKTRDNDGKVSF